MDEGEFADRLGQLFAWRRKQLPELDIPQGIELLVWLLEHRSHRLRIGALYKASRHSDPTMRKTVKAFVQRGFARIEPDPDDARRSLLQATPKLSSFAVEYARRLSNLH